MSNPYFNGTQLPSVPASFSNSYPYRVIIRNLSDTNWILLGCTQKMWYDSSKDSPAINQSAGSMGRCFYSADTDTWGELGTGNWYYTYSRLLWSSYDIPIGSTTGSEIYFKAAIPTVSPLHLVNTWESAIGNGVSELSMNLSGCAQGNLLLLAYTTRGANNQIALSEGWTSLGGGNNASDSGDTYQRIFFAYKLVDSENESIVLQQTETKRIYAVCSEYYGAKSATLRNDLATMGTSNYTVSATKENPEDIVVYATSSAYYGSGRLQTVTPADIQKIEGDSTAERLACWFDGGLGAIGHTFQTFNSSEARDAILECVQLYSRKLGYASQGTAELSLPTANNIAHYGSSVVKWDADTPDGTTCQVYFRKNLGSYQECSNGGSLPGLSYGEDITQENLFIQVVLSSEDVKKTPSFSGLQVTIQDLEDQDTIVLSFPTGNINSIQNAVGEVRVKYDGSGTLKGLGGPVLAFDQAFTPAGLMPKNNPNDAEHLDVSNIEALGVLMRVYYTGLNHPGENIEVSDVYASGTLTHVDDI